MREFNFGVTADRKIEPLELLLADGFVDVDVERARHAPCCAHQKTQPNMILKHYPSAPKIPVTFPNVRFDVHNDRTRSRVSAEGQKLHVLALTS